jgi:phage minor structural protein
MKPLVVYDWKTRRRLAYLQNAYDITYTQQLNSVWTAEFKLPYSDYKKQYCEPFNLVEIWDVVEDLTVPVLGGSGLVPGGQPAGSLMGLMMPITYAGYLPPDPSIYIPPVPTEYNRYVGLFRIMPRIENKGNDGANDITFTLEHVLGTLLDTTIVIPEVTLGGISEGPIQGGDTGEVITELLTYQNDEKWVLNECDFTEMYRYTFEKVNLLQGLYDIIAPLLEGYYWTFDTQNFPWELNLKRVIVGNNTNATPPVTDIRYKKNIFGITKKVDPRSICTRLHLFGEIQTFELEDNFGETIEVQAPVTINSVNPTGELYLDSPTGIENYGIIDAIIEDERFTTPQMLYDYGVALLQKLDKPFVTYELDIKTIKNAGLLKIGDVVRVITDDGLDQNLVVQEITKDDLTGSPNSGTVIIGEGTIDLGLITKSFI